MYLNGIADKIENAGRKVIKVADQVSDAAQRVSGAVKGAAVGSRSPDAKPYLVPALAGAVGVLLLLNLRKR